MTILWTFYNLPRGNEYFEVKLTPSIGDYIFQFNLAVRAPDDSNWRIASKDFISGKQASGLRIEGLREHDLFLLVKDENGTKKRIKYKVDDYWIDEGDKVSTQRISKYRQYFISSLGISEEEMYCKALFEEYQDLKAKTCSVVGQDLKRGQSYKLPHINPQDLIKKKSLAKELVKRCKSYFKNKPDEWHNLEMDAQD